MDGDGTSKPNPPTEKTHTNLTGRHMSAYMIHIDYRNGSEHVNPTNQTASSSINQLQHSPKASNSCSIRWMSAPK